MSYCHPVLEKFLIFCMGCSPPIGLLYIMDIKHKICKNLFDLVYEEECKKHPIIIKSVWYYKQSNLLHRDFDLPAIIHHDDEGNIVRKEWWVYGERHRGNDMPANVITSNIKNWNNITISCITSEWWYHGRCHRDYSPAIIVQHGSNIVCKEWWIQGKKIFSQTYSSSHQSEEDQLYG